MPGHLFLDTVTLRNFAACDALDTLETLCNPFDPPYWAEAVQAELISRQVRLVGLERQKCRYILAQTWLGAPIDPPIDEQMQIFAIRTALSAGVDEHRLEHLGEAQTIWVAEQHGGLIATDDGPAFAYAAQRLGPDQVIDTVDLLRIGVSQGLIAADQAADAVVRMRSAGRILRLVHPDPLKAIDFE
jgi:hypothetical protein